MTGTVRVGISSWTEPTLVKSGAFYPPGTSSAEARLRYYASQFPIVEVDSSYYYLPTAETAGNWVDRTPPEFLFNVKAFSLLTGHPTRRNALPKELLGALPAKHRDKERIYDSHVPGDVLVEVWRRFTDALLPLDSAGKLGAVLMQFPEWFTPRRASRERLGHLRDHLAGYQVCVELRNGAWLAPDEADRTFALLAEHGLPFVCVDMPEGFRSSLPPVARATSSELAVVRFHGRDREAWAHTGGTASERFRYRYADAELGEWVPKLRELAAQARSVHAVMNNCYRDDAVVSARRLAALLGDAAGPAGRQPTLPGA